MQAPEHEVFHRVFHRQGANRSHKYPSAEFKISGMFYNMFTEKYNAYLCMTESKVQSWGGGRMSLGLSLSMNSFTSFSTLSHSLSSASRSSL